MRKRFMQMNGELVEVGRDYKPDPQADYHVMPDIKPYQSMIDGKVINSRSTHRDHLRANGCIEVGNETKYLQPRPKQLPPGLKQTLIEVTNAKWR